MLVRYQLVLLLALFKKIDTSLVPVLATFNFFDTSLVLVLGSILILGWYMVGMWHKIRAEMATIFFVFSVNRHNHNRQRSLSTFVFHPSTPWLGGCVCQYLVMVAEIMG